MKHRVVVAGNQFQTDDAAEVAQYLREIKVASLHKLFVSKVHGMYKVKVIYRGGQDESDDEKK
jgi:hypothetical protein